MERLTRGRGQGSKSRIRIKVGKFERVTVTNLSEGAVELWSKKREKRG